MVLRGGRVSCGPEVLQVSLWSRRVAGYPVVLEGGRVAGFPVVLKGGRVLCGPKGWQGSLWS